MENRKTRVAINGFGRIGRITFRKLLGKSSIEVVAINDLTDTGTLAHLLKYDSVLGKLNEDVKTEGEYLIAGPHRMRVFAQKDPANLPWKDLDVDIVVESSGHFLDEESVGKHISAGAKKVVISAAAKGNIPSVVLGVNNEVITNGTTIISNVSCTTNCAAPMIKIIDDAFGVEQALLTTVHAYTGDQNLVDGPHRDLRRARAAALSIIPTSTNAAKAVAKILPHLKGKLDGTAMRVPVPAGSVSDITLLVKDPTSIEEVNAAFKKAAETSMRGILEYSEDQLVSSDIVGNPHSCIFDSKLTMVMGNMVKVIGWYDNESGYSTRMADLVEILAAKK